MNAGVLSVWNWPARMPTARARQRTVWSLGPGGGLTEERGEEEALDLDPLAPEVLDGEARGVVAGDEPERGDDQVADADLEEALPRRAALPVEADLLQHDVLV